MSRSNLPNEHPTQKDDAFGKEGDYFICSTCGRSFPVSHIQGQCRCGRKICKECSDSEFCADLKCGWIVCKYCKEVDSSGKVFHRVCLPQQIHRGCLIVTACYGSPKSREVQFLRTLRDTKILKTLTGKKLMRFLEGIYYYFSPQASIFIREHERSRTIIRKLVISPFLKIFHKSENISKKIKNENIKILIMSWFILLNAYMFLLWNLFPLKNKNNYT